MGQQIIGCSGVCLQYKASRPASGGRYSVGQKWCTSCCIYLNVESLRCPCCNKCLRNRRRHALKSTTQRPIPSPLINQQKILNLIIELGGQASAKQIQDLAKANGFHIYCLKKRLDRLVGTYHVSRHKDTFKVIEYPKNTDSQLKAKEREARKAIIVKTRFKQRVLANKYCPKCKTRVSKLDRFRIIFLDGERRNIHSACIAKA